MHTWCTRFFRNCVLSLLATSLFSFGAIPIPDIYSTFDGGLGAAGTISGSPGIAPGQVGGALSFSRNDTDSVNYGDSGDAGTGNLSVSLWINPVEISGGAFFPVGKGNPFSSIVGWSFFLEDNAIIARSTYVNGGGDLRLGENHPIEPDTWTHIGMVINNVSGKFTAYFDGLPSGTSGNENGWSLGGGGGQTIVFGSGKDFTTGADLLVGRRSTDGASFNGAIDEFALWHESLTDAQMMEIFQLGNEGQAIPEPATAMFLLGLEAALFVLLKMRQKPKSPVPSLR